MDISIIGIDLAKSVFQLHGVGADGAVVLEKKVRRSAFVATLEKLPPCLIGMEACATSHYWARQIRALGHDIRLIPPTYVKPYVQRQKNDAADAAAICEAVSRPHMRNVPIKTEEQQGALVLHRARDLLTRQRTMTLNAIRAHLAEFGIIAAQGPRHVVELLARLTRALTQEQLAHEAEIDLTYLGGIERGRRNPSLLVIARIANALQIEPADLLGGLPKTSLE